MIERVALYLKILFMPEPDETQLPVAFRQWKNEKRESIKRTLNNINIEKYVCFVVWYESRVCDWCDFVPHC